MAGPQMMNQGPSTQEIARIAFQIWIAEGRPAGRAADHWRLAEERLGPSNAALNAATSDGSGGASKSGWSNIGRADDWFKTPRPRFFETPPNVGSEEAGSW